MSDPARAAEVRRQSVTVTDPDRIEDTITQMCIGNRSRCLSMPPGSTFSIEAAATGPLQASRLSTTVAYTSVGDHINLHRAVTGRTLTQPAPHSVPGRVGETVLLPPDREVGFDTPGVVLDIVRLTPRGRARLSRARRRRRHTRARRRPRRG